MGPEHMTILDHGTGPGSGATAGPEEPVGPGRNVVLSSFTLGLERRLGFHLDLKPPGAEFHPNRVTWSLLG